MIEFREENMKQPVAFFVTVAAAALISYATPALTQQVSVPANIAGAIADTNRPQTDKDLDAQRKPAEMLTFAGVKAGIVPRSVELYEASAAVNDVKRPLRFEQQRGCLFPFRSEQQARLVGPEVA